MRKFIFIPLLFLLAISNLYAQGYGADKVAFVNFLTRMYKNSPFDGVRVIEDYEKSYLISVLALDKSRYSSEYALNRVASVKAMSQASRFFNGADITSEMIIYTSEKSDGSSDMEIIEDIREHSVGYVKALEHLTNFQREDGLQVFIFCTPLLK